MDYQKYAETEIMKSNVLVPALTGTAMALILMDKVFHYHGYSFSTILPSILLLFCLWYPFFQSLSQFKNQKAD